MSARNTIAITTSKQFYKLVMPMIEATFFTCVWFIVMTRHEVVLPVDQVL
jgi:hypothetical protein